MSKKMARKISDKTGSTLFEALEFIRSQMRCHEARMENVHHQRAQARECLQEARRAWSEGVPLALPNVGMVSRYIVPKAFFVCSWFGKRAKISQSSQRDCEARQRDRVGLMSYEAALKFEVEEV